MTILTKIIEDLENLREDLLHHSSYYGSGSPMEEFNEVIQRLLDFDELLERSFGGSSDLEFNLEEGLDEGV